MQHVLNFSHENKIVVLGTSVHIPASYPKNEELTNLHPLVPHLQLGGVGHTK